MYGPASIGLLFLAPRQFPYMCLLVLILMCICIWVGRSGSHKPTAGPLMKYKGQVTEFPTMRMFTEAFMSLSTNYFILLLQPGHAFDWQMSGVSQFPISFSVTVQRLWHLLHFIEVLYLSATLSQSAGQKSFFLTPVIREGSHPLSSAPVTIIELASHSISCF